MLKHNHYKEPTPDMKKGFWFLFILIGMIVIIIIAFGIQDAYGGTFGFTGEPVDQAEVTTCRSNVHADYIYEASAGDAVTKIYIYCSGYGTPPTTVDLAIYEMSEGLPTNRVGDAVTVTSDITDLGWYDTGAINIPLTAGKTYCIALGNEAGTVLYNYENGGSRSEDDGTTLDATWNSVGTSAYRYGLKADYENTPPSEAPARRRRILQILGGQ